MNIHYGDTWSIQWFEFTMAVLDNSPLIATSVIYSTGVMLFNKYFVNQNFFIFLDLLKNIILYKYER